MTKERKIKVYGNIMLVAIIIFLVVAYPAQIVQMSTAWSVEGLSVWQYFLNLGIQIVAYFYGRNLGQKPIWIPAIFNAVLCAVIIALYFIIRFYPL